MFKSAIQNVAIWLFSLMMADRVVVGFFSNDKNSGVDEIRNALESLAVDSQKDTTLIPIGSIVADFRQIIKSWKSDSFTLAGGNTLRLAIEVYQSENLKRL